MFTYRKYFQINKKRQYSRYMDMYLCIYIQNKSTYICKYIYTHTHLIASIDIHKPYVYIP
jgi:hypothetical protein